MLTARKNVIALVLLATGFTALYWTVITKLVSDWATDDNYSHGFLIVPIAGYLAWERRDRCRTVPAKPSAVGLAVVAGSIGLLALGTIGSELFLTRIAMLGTLAGTALYLFGLPLLRIQAFPLSFLLLMVPLPAIIFNQIAFPLQLLASRVGEFSLRSLDIPVLREGNVLVLATTTLEVAEACSGLRSLMSLLTLGIILGYFTDPRSWVRTTIALSTIPVAIMANGVRVAGTGVAASRFGAVAAEGFLHTFSGWLVFVVSFVLLIGLQRLIVRVAPLGSRAQSLPAVAA